MGRILNCSFEIVFIRPIQSPLITKNRLGRGPGSLDETNATIAEAYRDSRRN